MIDEVQRKKQKYYGVQYFMRKKAKFWPFKHEHDAGQASSFSSLWHDPTKSEHNLTATVARVQLTAPFSRFK